MTVKIEMKEIREVRDERDTPNEKYFEYLESQQNPDDIYYRFRKQKEKMKLKFEAQAAGEYLYNEAADHFGKRDTKSIR